MREYVVFLPILVCVLYAKKKRIGEIAETVMGGDTSKKANFDYLAMATQQNSEEASSTKMYKQPVTSALGNLCLKLGYYSPSKEGETEFALLPDEVLQRSLNK